MSIRRALALSCLATTMVVLGGFTLSPVRARSAEPTLTARIQALADLVAREWAANADAQTGLFASTHDGKVMRGYGQVMLAYSALLTAQRAAVAQPPANGHGVIGASPDGGVDPQSDGAAIGPDRPLADAAERALIAALDTRGAQGPGAFQQLAVARAWLDPRTSMLMSQSGRDHVAQYLRRLGVATAGERAQQCQETVDCYDNLKLVDALATLHLLRTGLDGASRGAKLGDKTSVRELALNTINGRLRKVADRRASWSIGSARRSGLSALSDPRPYPLAYHHLSVGMLAQAIPFLQGAQQRAAIRLLTETVTFSLGIAAPDGDISYMGRGQGRVWTQAASLYTALAVARRIAGADRERANELLALAELNLTKLLEARVLMGDKGGLAVVPQSRPGYDDPNHVTYNGLALYFLNLALDEASRLPDGLRASSIPSARSGAAFRLIDPIATGLAVMRRGDVWFAVHNRRSHDVDPRYDWGLLAVKHRGADGRWRDALVQRPMIEAPGATTFMGPALLDEQGKVIGRPKVTAARFTDRGIELSGRLYGSDDARKRNVTWLFAPSSRGVTLSFSARTGERWAMNLWRAARGHGSGWRLTRRVETGAGFWTLPTASRVRQLDGLFSSAYHPIMRADVSSVTARSSRTLGYTIAAR